MCFVGRTRAELLQDKRLSESVECVNGYIVLNDTAICELFQDSGQADLSKIYHEIKVLKIDRFVVKENEEWAVLDRDTKVLIPFLPLK